MIPHKGPRIRVAKKRRVGGRKRPCLSTLASLALTPEGKEAGVQTRRETTHGKQ